jgi:hypothetical protein
MMQNTIRHRIGVSLLGVSLALVIAPAAALAQSGSTGGSIGNDEKSLSGSRSPESERPARRSKPEADQPRRSSSRRGGGGAFDGAWVVNSVGMTCSGSLTTTAVVSSGKIIGQGVISGSVSANGSVHSVSNFDGIIVTSSGHTSGRSGSGTFKRSDGCVGRWTSSKQ